MTFCLPALLSWDHTFPGCAKQVLGHCRVSSYKASGAHAKCLDESGSAGRQGRNPLPFHGMCNPSSGNSRFQKEGSSQWMLIITGNLNSTEQTCIGALGVITLVLPAAESHKLFSLLKDTQPIICSLFQILKQLTNMKFPKATGGYPQCQQQAPGLGAGEGTSHPHPLQA